MPKKKHDGVKKRCDCPRKQWPKCEHPWHFSFHHGGREYRFSLDALAKARNDRPPRAKADAVKWRDRLRTEIREGTFLDPDAAPAPTPADVRLTLDDVAGRYLATYVPFDKGRPRREAGRKLMEWYVHALKRIEVPAANGTTVRLGALPFVDITKADVEAVRAGWPRKATCAKGGSVGADRALKRLRHLFNWAIEAGYTTTTPFRIGEKAVIHFATEQPRRRRLEAGEEADETAGEKPQPGEEARLLAHATSPLMHDLIIAALDTGCRPGELLALQWQHVNLTRCRLELPGTLTKTGKDRDVPYVPKGRLAGVLAMRRHDPAGEILPPTAHVFGDACGGRVRDIRDEWARTCAAASVVGLQFRDLRRTFGSELLETPGVTVHHVRDALGHADLKTTSIYLSTTLKALEDAMRRRDAHRAGSAHHSHTDPAEAHDDAPAHASETPTNRLN
jgi:integrase